MQSIVLLMWLAWCTEQDIRKRQITDSLTLGVATCALVWLFATGRTWIGADASDAGWALAIVMLLTLPGYMLGRFAADDVKLLGALALATSHQYVLGTFIGAGVAVVFWLLGRKRLWTLLNPKLKKRLQQMTEDLGDRQPFAPYLLVGFLLTAVWID
ncbi:prepilin peptidase [Pseudomonas capeferrum]|uniref:A24 family peptidase n=1 Tax=Pseudomonas capeferrum TaxID=1495066 RepID=UPI0015E2F3FD|nr:A24 family peptidase [Pseudomonas capeferrum]MBA1205080.1 prepilin peptidase [Pseudomonas capeferrum]